LLELDSYDKRILAALQEDGRLSLNQLAETVNLTTSPCWRRVKRLEEAGIIEKYVAVVDPEALGLGLNVFVYVTLDHQKGGPFEAAVAAHPAIIDCFAMSGDTDYLLRVVVENVASFDKFLRTDLVRMPGVDRTSSSFALRAIKKSTGLPVLGSEKMAVAS